MNNDNHIAPAKRFDATENSEQTPLKAATRFEADARVVPDEAKLEAEIDAALEPIDGRMALQGLKGKRWSGLAKAAVAGLGVLAVTETVLTLMGAYQQSPWLFVLYASVLGLVLTWGLSVSVKELLLLRRLRGADDAREQGQRIRLSVQTGEADRFIARISHTAPSEALSRFNELSNDYQNDAEKLALYEECVLTAQDKAARQKVSRYAMESAALLAASPLAVLDMAVILWRNQTMIREVADCYGVELGYWSRIRLIRAILVNIFYAGTTELVTDLGSQLLSVEMTGKLSARLAQGLGGGLLTARLGYQAMALCRPLTFLPDNKPRLSRIHTELLTELKSVFSSALNGRVDSHLRRNKDFTNS